MSSRAELARSRNSYRIARTTITSSTAETSIKAAEDQHSFCDLVRLIITNTSGTASNVTIRDVTGASNGATFAVAAGETVGFSGTGENAWPQATAGAAWTAQSSASVASIIVHGIWIVNN